MRKTLIILTVCAVMVSAFAVTGAASAAGTRAGNSAIRQWDVNSPTTGAVVGKLTVNLKTGHWTINGNAGRSNHDLKTLDKGLVGERVPVSLKNQNAQPNQVVAIGTAVVNSGGNIHAEGTITNQDTLDWIAQWGDHASVVLE